MSAYSIWTDILQVLANEPNKIFSLEDLENETGLLKENIQQALYRAYRRGDVERIAPGMYRYHDKFRPDSYYPEQDSVVNPKPIHIRSSELGYEIKIKKINLQILDEIIGQLKYVRNQIAHGNKKRRFW
jgi:hypothetical protein